MKKKELEKMIEEAHADYDLLETRYREIVATVTKMRSMAEAQTRYIEDLESLLLHGHVVDREPSMVFVGGGGGGGGSNPVTYGAGGTGRP